MRPDAPRALVIGSEGNIGTVLTRHLRAVGYEVAESDIKPGWRDSYFMADINHPLDLLPAFEWKPDVVFLLAALVGRMTSEQAASLAIATNLAGINNVLQLCKRSKAKCVFFSSSEVYGPQSDLMNDAMTLPRPNNRYGLSKLLGEQLVEYEVHSGGLQAVTLRPCMLYHEDEDTGDHRSAMIRFAGNLVAGKPIEVHAGSARGWLHAEDAVRGIEAAGRLEHYATINLGHPDVVPMVQLAEMVREYLGADPSLVRVLPLPPGMTLIKRPTLDRQRNLLDFEPRIPLAEGVRRVCNRLLEGAGRAPGREHSAPARERRAPGRERRVARSRAPRGAGASRRRPAPDSVEWNAPPRRGGFGISRMTAKPEPIKPAPRPLPEPGRPGALRPPPEASGRAVPLRLEAACCCICNHADAAPIGVGEDFEYRSSPDTFLAMRCRECGLVYLGLRPAMSELDRIYPPDYHAFNFSSERFGLAHRVRAWLEARRLLPWCRDLAPQARIIDVGCGDGFHLDLLRKFGVKTWRLEGVDASERAVKAGRARGMVMHLGTAQEVPLSEGTYDFALLIATIEHVDDPPAVLRAVHKWLRPGGRVLVVTDNTDTTSFRLAAGRYWGGYHFPRHWNLFDARTLRSLARAAGFEIDHLSTIVSPVNWIYSIHNALVDWHAPAWLVNRFTLASPGSLAVFTAFDWLQQLAGRGGLVRAVLRKPSPDTAASGKEHAGV